MKRIFLLPLTAAAVWCAMPVHADEPVETDSMTPDSMKLYELQQIEVTATRVDRKTPVAYADIGREAISRRNFGSDMPTLLQMTPSVVATSDAGNGIGGTAFRLRGSDASRINVTTNGVPMNDAESHSVYWYDTPDMASSVGTIQVQRGAGTSTNGTGAFGGSVNMTTAPMSSEFSGEASLSYGSYNTNKQSLQIGSGAATATSAVTAATKASAAKAATAAKTATRQEPAIAAESAIAKSASGTGHPQGCRARFAQ